LDIFVFVDPCDHFWDDLVNRDQLDRNLNDQQSNKFQRRHNRYLHPSAQHRIRGLRRSVSWASMWIWVTAAGWMISFPLAFSIYTWVKSISDTAFIDTWEKTIQVTLIAIFIGVLQWLLLRRYISRSGWWILANLIGWNAAGLLAGAGAMVSILESIPMGICVGAVTGLALILLLQHPGSKILETSRA